MVRESKKPWLPGPALTGGMEESEKENVDEAFSRAMKSALRMLGHRAHSIAELKTKLRRKFDRAAVQKVIDKLNETGCLDDFSFACEYARSRLRRSPRSPGLILGELGRKGIKKETAARALCGVMEEEGLDEDSLAEQAAKKKLSALAGTGEPEKSLKLLRFLAGRGFTERTARRAVERIAGLMAS